MLSACGGGGGGEAADGGAATVSVFGTEPENTLIPGNTNETGGGKIVDAMWDGLVDYSADGTVSNLVAQSIETTDSKTFTITLNEGWTFHDGTPVLAKNFVDAWNYTAYSPNGLANASFFANVAGYADVHPADENAQPTAQTMSGLKVVDDRTFTVELSGPSAIFPTTLGYTVFYPLPDSFFADRAAFEQNPIGNGAFRYESRQPNQNVMLTRYDQYAGPQKPSIGGVEFRIYGDSQAAYQDVVSGNLDFLDTIPGSFLVDDLYKTDLPERSGSQPYQSINTMSFPLYDQRYSDVRLRQAISMAVDRQAIADTVYSGSVEPADGFVPRNVPGRAENQCGELCTFQPEKAKQLFTESGFTGPIELISNVDSAINQEWMQAACVSITNALGAECRFVPVPTFAEFLTQRDQEELTGIFRTGWIADYPSIENFLNPIYRVGGAANDAKYNSPQFEQLMARGDTAPTLPEAEAAWQEAERQLVKDMPSVPINDQSAQFGWSERLQNAQLSFRRELDLSTVTVTE
ncbi:hypothetical protein AFB00_06340 [Pseudonocardia sp. HH130630-07]|nr:hypothetical protein AFB00_06340 [Pseudonocardia sp. HH130630-07]